MINCLAQLFALCLFVITFVGVILPQEAKSAGQKMSAATSMVVVDAKFANAYSPEQVIDYEVTHYLQDVSYVPYLVSWSWGPLPGYDAWGPGSTPLTSSIWSWRTSDGGRTYTGSAWDYLLNSTTNKHKSEEVPNWIGTMISSLCHTNATCNAEERTPMAFFPSLSESSVSPGSGYDSFLIEPNDVGVFYQNKTQQFKAVGVKADGSEDDLTNEVDWYIDPKGAPYKTSGMSTAEGAIATIDINTGLATVTNTWGRVMVHACYPKGCWVNSKLMQPGANHLLLKRRKRPKKEE